MGPSTEREKFFVLCLIALLAWMGFAKTGKADDYVAVTLASKHFIEGEYNEVNPGLGFVRYGALTYEAGCYHNSYADTSCYGTVGTPVRDSDRLHFTAGVGLVHGYDWGLGPGGLTPMAKGAVRVPAGPGLVSFELLPGVTDTEIGLVVGLQYMVRVR